MEKNPTSSTFPKFAREVKKECGTAIKSCNAIGDKKFKALCKATLAVFDVVDTGQHSFKYDPQKQFVAMTKDKGSAASRSQLRAGFVKKINEICQKYYTNGEKQCDPVEAQAVKDIIGFMRKFKNNQENTYETTLNQLKSMVEHSQEGVVAGGWQQGQPS